MLVDERDGEIAGYVKLGDAVADRRPSRHVREIKALAVVARASAAGASAARC